jgi:hypothetical protein
MSIVISTPPGPVALDHTGLVDPGVKYPAATPVHNGLIADNQSGFLMITAVLAT